MKQQTLFKTFVLEIFTQKVSKQNFVAKIRDSYLLFVWAERDTYHSEHVYEKPYDLAI